MLLLPFLCLWAIEYLHLSPLGAAAGCDLLTLIFHRLKTAEDQKIAAFGSSYTGFLSVG
jgi:hypothetical protein